MPATCPNCCTEYATRTGEDRCRRLVVHRGVCVVCGETVESVARICRDRREVKRFLEGGGGRSGPTPPMAFA